MKATFLAAAATTLFASLAFSQVTVPEDLAKGFGSDSIGLQLSFGGDASEGLADGAVVSREEVRKKPTFALTDTSGVNTALSFTILMVDTTDDNERRLHFLQTDFSPTGEKTKMESKGSPTLEYRAPGSFGEKGKREYSFLMYLQRGETRMREMPEVGEVVDIKEFEKRNGLPDARTGLAVEVDLGEGEDRKEEEEKKKKETQTQTQTTQTQTETETETQTESERATSTTAAAATPGVNEAGSTTDSTTTTTSASQTGGFTTITTASSSASSSSSSTTTAALQISQTTTPDIATETEALLPTDISTDTLFDNLPFEIPIVTHTSFVVVPPPAAITAQRDVGLGAFGINANANGGDDAATADSAMETGHDHGDGTHDHPEGQGQDDGHDHEHSGAASVRVGGWGMGMGVVLGAAVMVGVVGM